MTAWHEMSEPIDSVHYDAIANRAIIHREFDRLKAYIMTWWPEPMPADFGRDNHHCRRGY